MHRLYFIIVILLLFVAACDSEKLIPPEDGKLIKLEIESEDSITLNVGESRTLALRGVYETSNTTIVTNTGLLQSTTYYNETNDSVFVPLRANDAEWVTANYTIASVYAGTVLARSTGTTYIYAQKDNISSQRIDIIVH